MIHALKQEKQLFCDVLSGRKLFEVRLNDRDFKVGDLLALNEWNPETKEYTGRSCLVYINYILDDEAYVKSGYVVMTIKPCIVRPIVRPESPVKIGIDYEVPLCPNTALEVALDE